MKYFLKQCGHQELGSVDSFGKIHRGRYLLISMASDILNFFPPLSKAQFNDFVPVACKPLFGNERKVYCNLVYHNDKYHGSTAEHPRNEYRLYLNKELEGGSNLFKVNDIIVFRKENMEDINSLLYIFHVPYGCAQYESYLQKITSSPLKGKYAVFDGEFPDMEKIISLRKGHEEQVAIDEKVIQAINSNNNGISNIERLFNSVMFRDFLLVGYEGLCAITRTVIRHGDLMNIEAAHIRPKAHLGTFLPNNGLMLSRDLHWAFDKGFFTIADDFTVLIHPESHSDFLTPLQGRKIFLPRNAFFSPNLENIRWHQNNIYGQFKNIREINLP